jgi:hypothetical protein
MSRKSFTSNVTSQRPRFGRVASTFTGWIPADVSSPPRNGHVPGECGRGPHRVGKHGHDLALATRTFDLPFGTSQPTDDPFLRVLALRSPSLRPTSAVRSMRSASRSSWFTPFTRNRNLTLRPRGSNGLTFGIMLSFSLGEQPALHRADPLSLPGDALPASPLVKQFTEHDLVGTPLSPWFLEPLDTLHRLMLLDDVIPEDAPDHAGGFHHPPHGRRQEEPAATDAKHFSRAYQAFACGSNALDPGHG